MLQQYKTRLTGKTQLSNNVFLLDFMLDEPKELIFIPGQYMIMMVPQEGGELIRRLYSIASSNTDKNKFELLIEFVPGGKAAQFLSPLVVGSTVMFQGPAGLFTMKESPRDKVFLMTGTGYAPARSMLLSMLNPLSQNTQFPNTSRYALFWGFQYFKDVYLFDELKHIKSQMPNFDFHICLSREQNLDMIPEEDKKHFLLGRVTNGLEQYMSETHSSIERYDYYLCSGRVIVDSLKQYLDQYKAPKQQVFFEKF